MWPAVAIGDELAARGHEVAWSGPEVLLRPLVGPDATIYPTGTRSYRELREVGKNDIRELWDTYLMPLSRFVAEPVDSAVTEFKPDVIVADQYALAGTLAAIRHGVKWASLVTGILAQPARR